jgi:hypothetical protein
LGSIEGQVRKKSAIEEASEEVGMDTVLFISYLCGRSSASLPSPSSRSLLCPARVVEDQLGLVDLTQERAAALHPMSSYPIPPRDADLNLFGVAFRAVRSTALPRG